jgi:hypothetical protein
MNMEEKKTKKTKKPISDSDGNILVESLPELSGETVTEKKKSNEKIAHTVILVRPHMVVYRCSDGTNSFTENMWGINLKPGDMIYL